MNYQEIIEKINETEISKNDFAHEWYGEAYDPIFGPTEESDQQGGSGQGEDWWVVRYFKDHDVYVRLCGFYSSYNGVDFDGYDYEEVTPAQETRTIYINK